MLLFFLFIVVPILELAVIIQVGEAIGVWWTIALLLGDALLGAWLLRHQGSAAWRRFNVALAERRVPTREVLDGVLIVFGGALLITPGFLSDILGLLLLAPPTRALVRGWLVRRVASGKMRVAFGGFGGGRGGGATGRPGFAGPGYDVDGTAHEVPPEPPQLPS
jgi:UPF0716 protein FxsA